MTWMPKFRGTDEEEQDRDGAPTSIPPADAKRLAEAPYSLKPTFTDDPSAGDPSTPFDEWVQKHPQGLDLGSNEKEVNRLRAARDAVKNKARPKVDVGRPEMPTDQPLGFTSLAQYAPRDSPPSSVAQADQGTGGSGTAGVGKSSNVDHDMLDAEMLANKIRSREGMYQAGRIIGRAGLAKNPQDSSLDAQAMARADEPLKFVAGQKAETRKKAEDSRLAEDQGFQRQANTRADENQGFNREEQVRKRDYGDERSQISVRRRAEAMALYPKEIARVPKEVFNRMTAGDVDVLLKELNMQKDRASGAASQKDFLRRLDALGKGSQQFGELDQLGQRLEQISPGITSGHAGKDMNLDAFDKLKMAAPWGVGEGFVDQNKRDYSHALDDLQAQIGYMRSGKVINEHEEAGLKSVLGRLAGQPPDQQARGIAQVFQQLKQRQQNFQAGYGYGQIGGETPLGAFEKAGGTSYRRPPGGGGPQTAGGKIPVSNGQETMMIDPSDESDAARDGYHRVR